MISRLLLVWLLAFTTIVHARHYSDFFNLTVPAPHSLENVIAFEQDQHGQTWLFTSYGMSVFRGYEFTSFRQFNLDQPIIDAKVLGNYVFLATESGLYRASLRFPHVEPLALWRSAEPIHSLHSVNNTLWLTAGDRLVGFNNDKINVAMDSSRLLIADKQIELPDNRHLYVMGEQFAFALADSGQLYSLSKSGGTRLLLNVSETIVQMEAWQDGLVLLTEQGRLLRYFPGNRQLSYLSPTNVNKLIVANDDIYFRQQDFIYSLSNPQIKLYEPNQGNNMFVDTSNNLWLNTQYDVQVSWWQPIAFEFIERPELADFAVVSDDQQYAIRGSGLYQQQNGRWQLNSYINELVDSIALFHLGANLWIVKTDEVLVIDKQTLIVTSRHNRKPNSVLLPYLKQQLIQVTDTEISLHSASGQQAQVAKEQCVNNCLPQYQITNYLGSVNGLFLATNKGLHFFDYQSQSFSTKRLDTLNGLSPIIAVLPATDNNLWLVYPDKVALFNLATAESVLYYSQLNRLFSAAKTDSGNVQVSSQRGWLELSHQVAEQGATHPPVFVHQPVKLGDNNIVTSFSPLLTIPADAEELRLVFNTYKQHPAQKLSIRFKYLGDETWSELFLLGQSLTLKNLRQGDNTLVIEARLEGQQWQHQQQIQYQMPYRMFQSKWVYIYGGITLLLVVLIVIYERFNRLKVVFKSIKQQAFISSLLESTQDGVWVADKDRELQQVNQAFSDITGFKLDEVAGKSFQLLSGKGRNHEVESLIWQEVTKSGFWTGEVWSQRKSGEDISIDLSVTRVETENKLLGKTDVKFVGVFSDVTMRKNSEKELRNLATRDPVTQLANRTLFIEYINRAIDTASPVNPNFAVVFFDLDNFRKVNESLGPVQGDKLIKQVGQRLQQGLEKGISVARLGGDEFAMLIPNFLMSGQMEFYIKRQVNEIQRKLQPAFRLANTEVNISASFGASIYPFHGQTPEFLMRCADTAMNKVKQTGRNGLLIYAQDMNKLTGEKLSLENELIQAIHSDQFVVYFQPKFQIKENQISGYEALIRWQNPNRGLVSPDEFIPLAEQNGLIRQLDTSVLRQVCRQIQAWINSGNMIGKVAVNVSALNFQQADFCQSIIDVLEQEQVPAKYIELEITETAMMNDPDGALANLTQLHDLGFSIALDDFGTGHSSLGYLKHFPIDRIKIDKTFVNDITESEQDKNITSVIIQLAKYLDIDVIAEGVETEQQAYILHVLGCNNIQGYYISKPLPEKELLQLIKQQHKLVDISRYEY